MAPPHVSFASGPPRLGISVLLCNLINVVTCLLGAVAIEWISKAFADESALLKHELAYCLGQMQDRRAIPALISVLQDTKQEPMVRHEAGKLARAHTHTHYIVQCCYICLSVFACKGSPVFQHPKTCKHLWLNILDLETVAIHRTV